FPGRDQHQRRGCGVRRIQGSRFAGQQTFIHTGKFCICALPEIKTGLGKIHCITGFKAPNSRTDCRYDASAIATGNNRKGDREPVWRRADFAVDRIDSSRSKPYLDLCLAALCGFIDITVLQYIRYTARLKINRFHNHCPLLFYLLLPPSNEPSSPRTIWRPSCEPIERTALFAMLPTKSSTGLLFFRAAGLPTAVFALACAARCASIS